MPHGTNQIVITPDDKLDPHVNDRGTFVLGVDDGRQHLSLFIADEATHRRVATALLNGLLQRRGVTPEVAEASEVCVECGEGEPFLLLDGDRRVCAKCAATAVSA